MAASAETRRAQRFSASLHGARSNPSKDIGTMSGDVGNDVPVYLWKRELLPTLPPKSLLSRSFPFLSIRSSPLISSPLLASPSLSFAHLSCLLHLAIIRARSAYRQALHFSSRGFEMRAPHCIMTILGRVLRRSPLRASVPR